MNRMTGSQVSRTFANKTYMTAKNEDLNFELGANTAVHVVQGSFDKSHSSQLAKMSSATDKLHLKVGNVEEEWDPNEGRKTGRGTISSDAVE